MSDWDNTKPAFRARVRRYLLDRSLHLCRIAEGQRTTAAEDPELLQSEKIEMLNLADELDAEGEAMMAAAGKL